MRIGIKYNKIIRILDRIIGYDYWMVLFHPIWGLLWCIPRRGICFPQIRGLLCSVPRRGVFFCFTCPFSKKVIFGKQITPQRKQNAHGPSLHIRFLSKCHFLFCSYNSFHTFWSTPTFLNYYHILIVLCISDSNMGDPRLL